MRFIFRPVAQNTIIRPMAQAVCLMHGGKETKYVDPTDGKEKVITSFDVSYLRLETMVKGRKFLMDGNQVAFHAEHYPQKASIRTEINDVDVYIYPNTTVASAMEQFRRKISKKTVKLFCVLLVNVISRLKTVIGIRRNNLRQQSNSPSQK